MSSFANNHREIAIIGYYGWGNFGDDILASYVLDIVCQTIPPDRIIVTGPEGNYLERWFPGIRCKPGREIFQPASYPVRKVIFGGGGQFFAFPPSTTLNLWGLLKCKAYGRWRMIGWSNYRRLSAYAFCVGVGPLEGVGARWITRKFFKQCEHISVRDDVSKNLLSGAENVRVVADPSIGLSIKLSSICQRNSKTLGIVVREWSREPNITNLIVTLQSAAHGLRSRGWAVEFISFHSQYDTRVTALLRNRGEDVRDWKPQSETIQEFCKYLSGFQVLITLRAHGVFLGSLLGTVPIAVSIEPKLEISAASCGCLDYMISVETSSDEIVSAVERASIAYPLIRNWEDDLQALELESNRLDDWLRT